jgi:hypothetical protein
MQIKKEHLQLGGFFFLNFSRYPLLTSLHWCLHHYKTLKTVATATQAIVVMTPPPPHFYHIKRPKFNLQPLSFTFETISKKHAKKNRCKGQCEEKQNKKN